MCVVCERVHVDLVRPEFSLSQNRCFTTHRPHIFNTPHLCCYCLSARTVLLAQKYPLNITRGFSQQNTQPIQRRHLGLILLARVLLFASIMGILVSQHIIFLCVLSISASSIIVSLLSAQMLQQEGSKAAHCYCHYKAVLL